MDIDTLSGIALAAGREIMAVYGGHDLGIERKADGSPVTQADMRAERLILAALARHSPGVPVIAEEETAAGRVPEAGRRFFLVDPLDGTREFEARNGQFTVNIALVEDGIPILGVVHAPAFGTLYGGGPEGAWEAKTEADVLVARRPIRTRAAPAELVAVGSRSHATPATAQWLGRRRVARFVASGSSLKFCVVAMGEADLYPRLGPTMQWDTAAGDAVLRAAGGIVTTLDGAPLAYGPRPGKMPYASPDFVAFGDPALVASCRED